MQIIHITHFSVGNHFISSHEKLGQVIGALHLSTFHGCPLFKRVFKWHFPVCSTFFTFTKQNLNVQEYIHNIQKSYKFWSRSSKRPNFHWWISSSASDFIHQYISVSNFCIPRTYNSPSTLFTVQPNVAIYASMINPCQSPCWFCSVQTMTGDIGEQDACCGQTYWKSHSNLFFSCPRIAIV